MFTLLVVVVVAVCVVIVVAIVVTRIVARVVGELGLGLVVAVASLGEGRGGPPRVTPE